MSTQWLRLNSALTPPSRGQPQAGFAHLRLPLTSNVRPHMNNASAYHCAWALLLAAALPALVVSAASMEWGVFAAITSVAVVHAIILGVPMYLLLRWKRWANVFTSTATGALVGCLPVGLLLWPAGQRWAGSSASAGGVSTMVNGVATRAGWENYLETVGVFALFGAASGFLYWLFLSWRAREA
jgi:hypothetical protein